MPSSGIQMTRLKSLVLHLCKALGLFALARFATRKQLRILCYHSFELRDESHFRAKMFLRGATLRRRLQLLQDRGFPVLRLQDALDALGAGRLPSCAIAITIDDGLAGVPQIAAPIFAE